MNTTASVFGSCIPGVGYTYRRAVYLVAVSESGAIAAFEGRPGYCLPGGGCLDNETAAQTILREVSEEIAYGVDLAFSGNTWQTLLPRMPQLGCSMCVESGDE